MCYDSGHMRPERPFRSDMVHPALREKGRAIPTPALPRRTIEREARVSNDNFQGNQISSMQSFKKPDLFFEQPGPVPGVRPPVVRTFNRVLISSDLIYGNSLSLDCQWQGGAGHVPTAPKGSGTMGIIMPMYTIGIVCFFVYTLMKVKQVLPNAS